MARIPRDSVDRDTPESRFLAEEHAQTVRAAVLTAGSRGRKGVLMAAMGYTGREIASTLGSSETATRALMYRARTHMRRSLTGLDTV